MRKTKKGVFVSLLLFLTMMAEPQQQAFEPQLKTRSKEEVGSNAIRAIPGMQCVTFDPKTLTKEEIRNGPKVFGNLHWLYGNRPGPAKNDVHVLKIIQHYGMNASCTINDSYFQFHFMLVDGHAPTGKMSDEDCRHHHVSNLHIVYYGPGPIRVVGGQGSSTGYRIVARYDGRDTEWVYAFDQKEAALAAMQAILEYGLSWQCYYPPSLSRYFKYLKAD